MVEHLPECPLHAASATWQEMAAGDCICDRLAQAEARTVDAIRDRILDYAAGLDGKASRSVALTCAGLATVAGLR